MNLYTILINFDDHRIGVDQVKAKTPERAFLEFILTSECLEGLNRQSLRAVASERISSQNLLIHLADDMKGLWTIDFGVDLQNSSELTSMYGGHIVQTDPSGPERK